MGDTSVIMMYTFSNSIFCLHVYIYMYVIQYLCYAFIYDYVTASPHIFCSPILNLELLSYAVMTLGKATPHLDK